MNITQEQYGHDTWTCRSCKQPTSNIREDRHGKYHMCSRCSSLLIGRQVGVSSLESGIVRRQLAEGSSAKDDRITAICLYCQYMGLRADQQTLTNLLNKGEISQEEYDWFLSNNE